MNSYFDKPGVHVATPILIELTQAKTGAVGLRIDFRIEEGEYDGEPASKALWLTEKAWPYTKKALRCCGALIDGLGADEIIERVANGTLEGFGKRVKLVVGEEAGLDGEVVYRVNYVNPLTERSEPDAEPDSTDLRSKAAALLAKFHKPQEAMGVPSTTATGDASSPPATTARAHATPGASAAGTDSAMASPSESGDPVPGFHS